MNEILEKLSREALSGWKEGWEEVSSHACVTTLLGKQCPGWNCLQVPGSDHESLWTRREGKEGWLYIEADRVLVIQPWALGLDDMRGLVKFCDEHGLNFTLSGHSWYYPTLTTILFVYKKG